MFYNTCDVGIALGVSLVANISFVFAGAAVGDNAWASSSAGTALLDDPLYGAARVLSERAWGGPAAVCLLSGASRETPFAERIVHRIIAREYLRAREIDHNEFEFC